LSFDWGVFLCGLLPLIVNIIIPELVEFWERKRR